VKSKLIKTIASKGIFFFKHWSLFSALLIFALLLAKNPFSDRTLIPNFEPFPDTFHYVVAPNCWLQGEGWKLCREGMEGINSSIAPLYGISLIPFFVLKNDPRMFYFGNVFFALSGLFIFYLIIKKILCPINFLSLNSFLTFFTLFLYVTSYHLYWYPTLAMASNFLLPLFLLGIYLLTKPVSLFRASLALILAGSFFATKYSAIPLLPTYLIIYLFKILLQYKNDKKLLIRFISLFAFITILILSFKNFYLSKLIYRNLYRLFFVRKPNDWFSLAYFGGNFNFYLNTILGEPTKVLWDFRPFYPIWLGVGAMIGYFWALFKRQGLAIAAILLLSSQIIFMSLFYDNDGRYIFIALPVAFIGFAYFLKFSADLFGRINKEAFLLNGKNVFLFFVGLVFIIFGLRNFTRIKSQISLNLKYAEQPWYYLSVLEFNEFFTNSTTAPKPILISAAAPFLIDFYSNGNYSLLPLSSAQEFRKTRRVGVWGENDYSDLISLYKKKMTENHEIYLTNYGLENNSLKIQDFKNIIENFTSTKVRSGCHDQCNIYKLEL
jgi:hypothetical protein